MGQQDINYSLRRAYNSALTGIEGVPAFYNTVPEIVSHDKYIVFRSITNTGESTGTSSDVECQITVEIQTFNDGLNDGDSADLIAREVFNRINPGFVSTLTMDGAQIVNTRLLNDITQPPVTIGNRAYVGRIITFGHRIFITADLS